MLLHVTDFCHYLYIAAPVGFTPEDCKPYQAFLESKLAQFGQAIHSVSITMRENLYGFQGNEKRWFIKITVTDPKHITKLRSGLERNIQAFNYKGLWPTTEEGVVTFDNIQYVLRFMIDTGVRMVYSIR